MKKINYIISLILLNVAILYSQTNDPAVGTFYQEGGKVFTEANESDSLNQIRIKFCKDKNVYRIFALNNTDGSITDSVEIGEIDNLVTRAALSKIIVDIDSTAIANLTDLVLKNKKQYELNKLKSAKQFEKDQVKNISYANDLSKNSGKKYNTILAGKENDYQILVTYNKTEHRFFVKNTTETSQNKNKEFFVSSFERNDFIHRITFLFLKDFTSFETLKSSNDKDSVVSKLDSLNIRVLGEDFFSQIMQDIHSFEMKKNTELAKIQEKAAEEMLKKALDKEKRNIGKIGFVKDPEELLVPVYSWYNNDSLKIYYPQIGDFKVSYAQIAFGEGVITKLNVTGTLKNSKKDRKITFYNFSAQIPIRTRWDIDEFNNAESENRYWLDAQLDAENDNLETQYFIYLSDVLFYEQNIIHNYGIYLPPDGKVVTLNSEEAVFDLKKESFINDFDLRLYTDVTGLKTSNPNGIFKFMGFYKLNTGFPKRGVKGFQTPYYSSLVWFDFIDLFFIFNKIEGDKLTLPLEVDENLNMIYAKTIDLYRYSKFELGIDVNFFNVINKNSSWGVNFIGGIYNTPVEKVSSEDTTSTVAIINGGVNSWYYGFKGNYKFFANEYVDVDLAYSFIIPKLISEEELKVYNGTNIHNKSNYLIHRFDTQLNIFPDPQDKASYLFLRSVLNINNTDNYISLLLGYSLPFSKLFSLGKSVQ